MLFASGANNANYYDPGDGYTDPTNCLTPVGAFAASPGPYGTYDMGGDIWQWNEAIIDGEFRGFRGGCCDLGAVYLPSSVRDIGFSPPLGSGNYGFRVAATIPEPGDANGDGTVDVNDLAIVLSHFGDSGCTWPQGCMDGDPTGTVDINDLTLVLANFGYGVSAGAGLKARAHEIVDALPDKAGWEELMYQVYVEQALDRGLADVRAGRVIEHSKLLAKYGR